MADWSKLPINEKRIARNNYLETLSISNDRKFRRLGRHTNNYLPKKKKQLAEQARQRKRKKPSLVNSPSSKSN
jgi:hypothetical protein